MSGNRVIVIGGGLAGCSAALRLADRGYCVTLLEAKSRLGGRVGSYTDATTGHSIDYCQHVGMGCCHALLDLIDRLDQRGDWLRESELHFFGPDGRRQTLRALPWLPAPMHLIGWLVRWPGLRLRDRIGIGRAMLALDRLPLADAPLSLDRLSALEWLRIQHQSPTALDRFWTTIVVSALGEELGRVGVLAMAKVFQDGFLRHRDAYHLVIPQRPLAELFGTRFHAALEAAGVDVRLNANVAKLNWCQAACESVQLADGLSIPATQVVVAVPWHAVSKLVSDCPMDEVRQTGGLADALDASPISGVHTWWNQAWLPTPHAVIVGRLCQWVFPHAESRAVQSDAARAPAASSHYYQIVISASRGLPRGDNERVRQLIEADLKAVFPSASAARLERFKVVTDPQAVFSVAPGSNQVRPAAGRHDGNIYWAGDWLRTGWPATMEGAILSGTLAAQSLMNNARPAIGPANSPATGPATRPANRPASSPAE